MDHIKEYNKVDSSNESVHFRITRIEDYYSARKGEPDEPHRHDYFTILVANKAKGKHIIDFEDHDLAGNQVYFISPGQVHQVMEENKSYGFSIVFSEQFLIENHIPTNFLFELNLFNHHSNSPLLEIDKTSKDELNIYCENLILSLKANEGIEKYMSGAYLKQFLIKCSVLLFKNSETNATESNNSLFIKFRKLVELNYSTWHSVTDYSNSLNITPDHLNRTIKSLIGKTTKEYIHSRIHVAAKRMLFFTDLTNKEIGYQLGFTEPSHFSASFKKSVGVSPRDFKNSI
jgi:AraC-like DNA-binding protein